MAVTTAGNALINSALWWRDHVSTTPDTAGRQAVAWLRDESPTGELHVLSRHIMALVEVERGQLVRARQHARHGVSNAEELGLPIRTAQLRLTLAWIESDCGSVDLAWRELAAAEPALQGCDVGRLACLRGLLRYQQARYALAVEELSTALPRLSVADRRWTANARSGRGLAYLYLGRLADADEDLAAAEGVFAAGGQVARAAGCRHNRGCVAYQAGDLPRALRLFDEADAAGLDVDSAPEALVDRAEAQAAAGLHTAARRAMGHAAECLADRGRGTRLAETRLALANLALREDDPHGAVAEAARARRLFREQQRAVWAELARAVYWHAKLSTGQHSRSAIIAAQRAAAGCARSGWRGAATRVWLSAGQTAMRLGWRVRAEKLFTLAARLREDDTVSARERAMGWLAAALLAELGEDQPRLFDACRMGLREVERHLAAIPAFELRVHAWACAADIGAVATRAALRTGDARLILRWTERLRASALHRQVLRPPVDDQLKDALARLRSATLAVDQRERAEPAPSIGRLEERVRHRAMLVDGETRGWLADFGVTDVCSRLGDSVLLAMFAHGDTLFAVSVVDGKLRSHVVGPRTWVEALVSRLRHALARQAYGGTPEMESACSVQAEQCARQLQEVLLHPIKSLWDSSRPLVVVPAGHLHVLPWARLPACRNRRVTVTPSLRCWLRGATEQRCTHQRDRVWIAGPGLEHAEHEVRGLHRVAGGRLLVGAEAAVDRALHAMDGADVVHVAAHGKFRQDQPLLSYLRLGDGPLYAYDLDRLRRGPGTVVLSACEVGNASIAPGEHISGLPATLLSRGTSTVVASVLPVPDERAERVMTTLHAGLRDGWPPAAALAEAQARHRESGFVCLGYGG